MSQQGQPPRALQSLRQVDAQLVACLQRCLAPEESRPSAAEILQDPFFASATDTDISLATPLVTPPPAGGRFGPFSRRSCARRGAPVFAGVHADAVGVAAAGAVAAAGPAAAGGADGVAVAAVGGEGRGGGLRG